MKVYNYNVDVYSHYGLRGALSSQFRDQYDGDCFSANFSGTIEEPFFDFIKSIKNDLKLKSFSSIIKIDAAQYFTAITINENKKDILLIIVHPDNIVYNPLKNQKISLSLEVYGNYDLLEYVNKKIVAKIPPSPNIISWNYLVKNERNSTPIFLDPPKRINNFFYPWLQEDPYDYIDRFMASETSAIILRGEPGTGKTSFLKNMIFHSGENAMMTYETDLFESDDMFVDFISSEKYNLLIMEDADSLLFPRSKEHNTAMSKFLNITEGIIKFKKSIRRYYVLGDALMCRYSEN